MYLLFFIIIFLSHISQNNNKVDAFKNVRSFTVTLNVSNAPTPIEVTFDRGIIPIEDATAYVCSHIRCNDLEIENWKLADSVKQMIRDDTAKKWPDIIDAYFARSGHENITMRYPWLDLADEKTRMRVMDTIQEVSALRFGRIRPRASCMNNHTVFDRYTGCILTNTFSETIMTEINNGTRQTMDFWWKAAEVMFNTMYYDHAEALAYMIVRAVTNSNVDFTDVDLYRNFLVLLTEAAKEKGYSEHGVFFGMHAIDLSTSVSTAKAAWQRLRVLLTVPPIPQETSKVSQSTPCIFSPLHMYQPYIDHLK